MNIALIWQVLKYIRLGLPVVVEIFKAISEVQKAFSNHQKEDKNKNAIEKKVLVKEMLRAKGIDEVNTPHLDDAINFSKALLKNNGAFEAWIK